MTQTSNDKIVPAIRNKMTCISKMTGALNYSIFLTLHLIKSTDCIEAAFKFITNNFELLNFGQKISNSDNGGQIFRTKKFLVIENLSTSPVESKL